MGSSHDGMLLASYSQERRMKQLDDVDVTDELMVDSEFLAWASMASSNKNIWAVFCSIVSGHWVTGHTPSSDPPLGPGPCHLCRPHDSPAPKISTSSLEPPEACDKS